MRTDDNVDYDELHSVAPDPAQIDQYNAKNQWSQREHNSF